MSIGQVANWNMYVDIRTRNKSLLARAVPKIFGPDAKHKIRVIHYKLCMYIK